MAMPMRCGKLLSRGWHASSKLNPNKLKPQAQAAFADFATVLSLVPDLDRWSSDEKDALREIIAAKAAKTRTALSASAAKARSAARRHPEAGIVRRLLFIYSS